MQMWNTEAGKNFTSADKKKGLSYETVNKTARFKYYLEIQVKKNGIRDDRVWVTEYNSCIHCDSQHITIF